MMLQEIVSSGQAPDLASIASRPRTLTLWDSVRTTLDSVAERLQLEPGIHAVLREPERELAVSIPVAMSDGGVRVFKGYRVQHSSAVRAKAGSATTRTSIWTRCGRWRH